MTLDRQGSLVKIRELSTGLVLEREPPTAREIVDHSAGRFEYVPFSTPSINERLQAMTLPELVAIARQVSWSPMLTVGQDAAELRAKLVPLLEAGTLVLP